LKNLQDDEREDGNFFKKLMYSDAVYPYLNEEQKKKRHLQFKKIIQQLWQLL